MLSGKKRSGIAQAEQAAAVQRGGQPGLLPQMSTTRAAYLATFDRIERDVRAVRRTVKCDLKPTGERRPLGDQGIQGAHDLSCIPLDARCWLGKETPVDRPVPCHVNLLMCSF